MQDGIDAVVGSRVQAVEFCKALEEAGKEEERDVSQLVVVEEGVVPGMGVGE